jgi:hypothetical protein
MSSNESWLVDTFSAQEDWNLSKYGRTNKNEMIVISL